MLFRWILILVCAASLGAAPTPVAVKASGGDYAATGTGLQAAIDYCKALESVDPCVITLHDPITSSAPVVLRKQSSVLKKWIILQTSKLGELPYSNRVGPSDVAKLAKIENTGGTQTSVILAELGSSYYALRGLEVAYTGVGEVAAGIFLGLATDGFTQAKSRVDIPKNFIIDRCYVHGVDVNTWVTSSSVRDMANGIRTDASNVVVRNNYVADIHRNNSENRGLHAAETPGSLYIYNNHWEASIGVLTGGSGQGLAGLTALGIYRYGNEYTRDPRTWHWVDFTSPGLTTSQPCTTGSYYDERFGSNTKYECVGGTWQTTTNTRLRRDWASKNGDECKQCRWNISEGNYIHDLPSGTDGENQSAACGLDNQVDTGLTWVRPEYIIRRYNYCLRTGMGWSSSDDGSGTFVKQLNNISIYDNLMEGTAVPQVAPAGAPVGASTGIGIDSSSVKGFAVMRNTMPHGKMGVRIANGAVRGGDFNIRDNIFPWGANTGTYGANGLHGEFGAICQVLWYAMRDTGAVYLQNWAAVNQDPTQSVNTSGWWSYYHTGVYNGYNCPASYDKAIGSSFGFVNFNDGTAGTPGDYRVCTGVGVPDASCTGPSIAASLSSGGGPLGARLELVSWATQGVSTGTPDRAWFEFSIRRASGDGIRYTSYDSSVCSVTVKNSAGTTIYSQADTGGVSRDRLLNPAISTPGIYTARVTCTTGGRYREAEFKVN